MRTEYSVFIADWSRLREVDSCDHLVELAYDDAFDWIELAKYGYDVSLGMDDYAESFVSIYDRLPKDYATRVAEFVAPFLNHELNIQGIKKWDSTVDPPYKEKDRLLAVARSPTTLANCLSLVADLDFEPLQTAIDENPAADRTGCFGDGNFRVFFDAHRRICELACEKEWGAVWQWFE